MRHSRQDDAGGPPAPGGAARFLIMLAQYAPREPEAWPARLARALARALRRVGARAAGKRRTGEAGKVAAPAP